MNANSYISKQNPFKGENANMQSHAQYVNQPHHLVVQGGGRGDLANIMAISGDRDREDILNLHNLYPQSQSPMSFKQMRGAKR